MGKKEENPLFVGITKGGNLRRNVLECSKDILESLKDYERFKSVREEKIKLVQKFKDDVKEVSSLMNKVRVGLPKVKEMEIKKQDAKKVQKPKVTDVEMPEHKTEMERLEAELNDIERKLNTIS